MTHLRLKLAIAGIVFAGAIGYLAFAGIQKGWVYTVGVNQYLASPEQQKMRVRLCGTVAEDNVDVQKAQMLAKFSLKGAGPSDLIAVAYKGVVPDMFKPGCEVIVEGKRDAAGVFQADIMMTKCASKYEEMPTGHPKTGDKQAASAGGQP